MYTSYVGLEILLVMEEGSSATEIVTLLSKEGFLVTRLDNYSQAINLLENKFFVVALFDLDTPDRNEGLRLLKKCRQLSPVTHPVMLARHKCSANHVIKANNLGCFEFIMIRDVVGDYLIEKVKEYAALVSYEGERDRLLKKVADVHNKFFKRMFALHIKAMDAEEDLIAISGIPDEELPPIQILVVDNDDNLLKTLESTLTPELGWNFKHLTLASEALDQSASGEYHVALINKNLPDLPGTMVANTIQSAGSKTKSFVFTYVGDDASQITLFESAGTSAGEITINAAQERFTAKDAEIKESIENPVELRSQTDLVSKIRAVRQDLAATERKGHYAKNFKIHHFDFLQEYGKLREELKAALQRMEQVKPT